MRCLPVWRTGSWALMALVVGVGPAFGDTIRALEPSSEPIHVRVQFKADPQHQAVVSWTTVGEARGESHTLYVDTEPRDGDLDAYQWELPSTHSAAYSLRDDEADAGMHAWGHNVFLEDLEPSTRYYLTAVSDGEQSEEFYFKTAPDDDRAVKLLLAGDSRVGGSRTHPENNRRRVNALMRDLFEENPEILAMAHGADYTNRAYWSQLYFWLNDHAEKTTTEDGRLLPIIPSRGNHDLDVGFEEMFWWPERQNDYYYTTMLSPQVAFITLNTEISRGGDQREWLESELQNLRPQVRWLTGQWHRPAWPSVRSFASGSAQREAWVPLFERYELDLGYEAHDHALKRTYPIYDNEVNEVRGVVYIGDGGGGVSQRQPDESRWYLKVTGRHHHAHLLTFAGDALHGVAIDIDHNIVDEFVIDGGLRLLAGMASAEAFTQHLSTLLGDSEDQMRHVGQAVLSDFLAHHDPEESLNREAFLARMDEVFSNRDSYSPEKRRVAFQILLMHADHENDEAEALIDRGLGDPSDIISDLALTVQGSDLQTEAGREIVRRLITRGQGELREEAFAQTVNRPSPAFSGDRDEAEFEQIDVFELPREGWDFRKDQSRVGYFQQWYARDLDTGDWDEIEIGDFWAQFVGYQYVGVGWYRAEIEFPEMGDYDALGLHFGGVDENGWVWIDGEYVGQHNIGPTGWDVPFQLDVTDFVTPGRTHQIAVRVRNTQSQGGIWEPVELRAFREVE